MCASIHERVASAINVEIADLKHKDPCAKIPPLIQAKATDLDTLTYLMKEKLKTSDDYKTKIHVNGHVNKLQSFLTCLNIVYLAKPFQKTLEHLS